MQLKKITVKDVRIITKFLLKVGLKDEVLEMFFPKENEFIPKTWIEMRKHLQETYKMSDEEFHTYRKATGQDLRVAVEQYRHDFPQKSDDISPKLTSLVMDLLADDVKYEETIKVLAHLFQTTEEELEELTIKEVVQLVVGMTKSPDFLEQLQSSNPQKEQSENQV